MIWLVRVALSRPYTFIVLALAILIIGPLAAFNTPTDIFPAIRIPVIGVAWTYTGLSPDQMSGRIITPYERVLTTTVDNIQHIESTSLPGIGIVKIYFQPNVDIRTATAQVTSISQTLLKNMPPGATPPLILNYDASTVPVVQVTTSGQTLTEQQILDLTLNFMRPALTTIPGIAIPYSYGGKIRQIQVDLNPQRLQADDLSAQDVANAIAAQNQISPAGNVKIGSKQYTVNLNDAAPTIKALNDLPIKTVNGATIFIHDVANVRDGSPPQQSIVHVNGTRAVLTNVLKTGDGSTLAVVQGVKDEIPGILATMPNGFKINLINDQSVFVKAAISGVIREGVIAAALTALMILLFLGSWRSTLIIATSIPLSVLCSVAALSAIGQTLNIMTLGGLALAVGILVDDGTVTIENINWHLEKGKDVRPAILDGASQIVTPAFVSLLCICVVFVPMFALGGVAGFLFRPMAEAVVFAMIASFILSRTLVPTLAAYLLRPHDAPEGHGNEPVSRNIFVRFQRGFESGFERARENYRNLLAMAMAHRKVFVTGFLLFAFGSLALEPLLGSNFFPSVDSGQITIHIRPPVGTRIEDASAQFGNMEDAIRQIIPPDQLANIVDNIGLPISSINLTYSTDGVIGYQDGDIFISLKQGHRPTADFVRILRQRLPQEFPGTSFAFLPADIVSQILNFGSPAPIDVQIAGAKLDANRAWATILLRRMTSVPGVADARIQQSPDNPQLNVNVDRSRIAQFGLNELNVTNSVATMLAGTSQVTPTYWLDPVSGVSYPIVTQAPEYNVDSMSGLQNIPINAPGTSAQSQILGGIATITRTQSNAVVTHYNIRPVIDIYATAQDRDLGGVTSDVRAVIAQMPPLPKGSTITVRGQAATMQTAFASLLFGLLGAIVLIYLLIVVNFQSWLDPFIIITALPAALAGILWMLFATGTTLSVPALTGAIMCMGVATANSILVVSFAREQLAAGKSPRAAAVEAGIVRFRPVLMTALAMIIGMTPMALGLGEGGEQNAPLGRAVIGGLIFATCATLLFVPVIFSIFHERAATRRAQAGGHPGGTHD
jgi:CzcA family heavy metal efflux pump